MIKINCLLCSKEIGVDCNCENPIGTIPTPLFVLNTEGSGVYEDGKIIPFENSKWFKKFNEA
jgi:hypothetical protein